MFENRGRIIRDGAPLDYEYLPSSIVGRADEQAMLETAFRPLFFNGTPCNAFLSGPAGTGKTVTTRVFVRDMASAFSGAGKRLDSVFVNCRIRSSEYAVILDLVRHFDPGFPDRGFSVEEMLSVFLRHVNDGHSPVVVVLDEVDTLLTTPGKNIVYQMTRSGGSMSGGASLSLVMISQKSLSNLSLDTASLSTFGRAGTVDFGKYSRSSLLEIVNQRVSLALYPGVIDDECVGLICDAAEPYGDARFAMEVLNKASNLAETKGADKVEADFVRKSAGSVYSDVSENKLEDLDLVRKVVLLSIARSLFRNVEVSMTHCEKTYAAACEEYGMQARKHTQYYSHVKALESAGIIRMEVRREPEGGRVSYIGIVGIPPRDLAEKLEEMIEADRRGGSVDEV